SFRAMATFEYKLCQHAGASFIVIDSSGVWMFDVVLLLTVALGGFVGAYWWLRRQAPKLPVPLQPLPIPNEAHFAEIPHALETAHSNRSGAIALNAIGTTRGRPGHRCIEEIRRRCEVD